MRCVAQFGTIYTISKREKHPWISVTFKPETLLKVTFLHGCLSRFWNCTNGTKSRNVSQIHRDRQTNRQASRQATRQIFEIHGISWVVEAGIISSFFNCLPFFTQEIACLAFFFQFEHRSLPNRICKPVQYVSHMNS